MERCVPCELEQQKNKYVEVIKQARQMAKETGTEIGIYQDADGNISIASEGQPIDRYITPFM